MKLDDVMTTQEAGERWNVPADSIKQCCLKRYANKQFTDGAGRFPRSEKERAKWA